MPTMDYVLLNCWPKKCYGTPKILQAIGKTLDCSPKPEGKALLLITTLTYVTEHGRVNLVPKVETLLLLISHTWCFNVPCNVHLMYYVKDIDINLLHFYKPSTVLSIMMHILLCVLPDKKGNSQYHSARNSGSYYNELSAKLLHWWHKCYRHNQVHFHCDWGPFHEIGAIPDTEKVDPNLRIDKLRTLGKTSYYYSVKWLLMAHC